MAVATLVALLASGTALANSGHYVPDRKNCAGSIEKWVRDHAGDGEKIIEARGSLGAFAVYLVRWDDGTVQEVTVGPTTDAKGNAAICVLAKRHVSSPGSA